MNYNAPDLHVHSTFSLLDGMGTPEDVVFRAVELGWGAACLTEHGWMGSAPAFYQACRASHWSKKYGGGKKPKVNPILGCEFYVASNEILGLRGAEYRWNHHHLTVLALSAEGYHNLVAWTTFASQRENFYDKPRISLEAMAEVAPHGLHHNVVLSGCLSSELCNALASANGNGIAVGCAYTDALKSLFPNFYIEVQNHSAQKFHGSGFAQYEEMVAREAVVREKLLAIARATGTPTVLTNDSHYQRPSERHHHLVMVAGKRNYGPGRIAIADHLPEYGYFTNYMRSMEKLAERTKGLPDDALANSLAIAEEADIRLDPLDKFSYSIPFSGYDDPLERIRKRSRRRLEELISKHGKSARKRFELELEAMGDFAHYLLLMSDFIIHAKKNGILTNTRGSAANSLLCYCLKIHDIDSMEYGLLFSRFFNPARKKLPDIDIDIEKDRYEDFMRYVIECMNELEGAGQVVQISNYGTFANRSSFRLIADALGMSKEEQDDIAKLLPQMIDSGMVDEENDVYEAMKEQYPEIYELASGVFDALKNISQHACGWVFGTKDRPLDKWVPQTLIASSGSTVTAYNLKYLEEFGLVKGDFLRLRTLSVIQRCRKMLGQDSLDITDIPLDDEKTFEMLRSGRTEGIFTLQGKENRKGVMEVEASSVHDVIASVAIYRPALTREGKHNLYNDRRRGVKKVKYAHPVVEKILGPTYGVPIFQEQVMEICYAVGMTDEQVDDVYRAIKMAKGVGRGAKEAFATIKPMFYVAPLVKKMTREEADGVWKDIEGSQGYGFNKGHASSYGILSVRAAFLKAHHPAEFFTALLDVYPEKSKYIAAARSEGFQFLPPTINDSSAGFSLDRRTSGIRIGLSRVKGLGPVAVAEILAGQPYSSYEDFRERTSGRAINKSRVESLAAVGALECVGVQGDRDDYTEFSTLGFTLDKPGAFRGAKPKFHQRRDSESGWVHAGLDRTVEFTEVRQSVSKLFWLPPIPKEGESKKGALKMLEIKASPWAQVKTYLLTAIDENGIPFQIMANEDKAGEVKILETLARHFRGCVVCLNGAVRQPFLTDGPMGFRFYGITGADYQGVPQVFGESVTRRKLLALVELHKMKRRLR
jgi:DNA polymerase-3 subunit alpha